jgi:hypothetical protein
LTGGLAAKGDIMPRHDDDSLIVECTVERSDPSVGIMSESFTAYATSGTDWTEIVTWSDKLDKVCFAWYTNEGAKSKKIPANHRAIEAMLHAFALDWYERMMG